MSTDDILMLAGDNLVPWIVCWRALGPDGPDKDEARDECERALRAQQEQSNGSDKTP